MKKHPAHLIKAIVATLLSPFLAMPWAFVLILIYSLGDMPGASDPFRLRLGHVGYSFFVAFTQASLQVALSAVVLVEHGLISFPIILTVAICCVEGERRVVHKTPIARFLSLTLVGLFYWMLFYGGVFFGLWKSITIDA